MDPHEYLITQRWEMEELLCGELCTSSPFSLFSLTIFIVIVQMSHVLNPDIYGALGQQSA